MQTETTTLRTLILAACECIDPHHQAQHWPDPIGWDGRPLTDQARDLIVLIDGLAYAADLTHELRQAIGGDMDECTCGCAAEEVES